MCTANNDYESAAGALKATMKLGFNSIHDKPENYLNLGRCLADISDGDTSEAGQKKAKEAIHTMQRVAKKFGHDPSVNANAALIEARTHKGQGDKRKSDEMFVKAKKLIAENEFDASTQLEFAKTLYSMGQTDEAETLLSKLAHEQQDDAAMIKSINELIDEPVGVLAKAKARKFNKSGIKEFEAGNLDAAIEAFTEALECTPKHPALNLNVVQVTLKMIDQKGMQPGLVERCKACLSNVRHIPQQHAQYKRFKFLEDKVAGL